MIEIIRGRGQGKTCDLIKLSAESGLPIVVSDYQRRNHIIKAAHCLGIKIPEPIVYTTAHCGRRGDFWVDDLDTCDGVTRYANHVASEIKGYTISSEQVFNLRKQCDERGETIKKLSSEVDRLNEEIKEMEKNMNDLIKGIDERIEMLEEAKKNISSSHRCSYTQGQIDELLNLKRYLEKEKQDGKNVN